MTKAKKAVAKKTETQVSTKTENETWGSEGIDAEDILIPRIMLMQGLSDLVTEGHASIGDFIDSLDKDRTIAKKGETFDVVVFGVEKKIIRTKNKEFDGMEDFVSGYKYDEVAANGDVIKRSLLMQFYVLLKEDIENGDAFPYVLSFTKTATKPGKSLATKIAKLTMIGKPSAARYFTIGTELQSNDHGKWFIPTIASGEETEQKVIEQARAWNKTMINSDKFKTDDKTITKKDNKPIPTQAAGQDFADESIPF